MIAPVRCPIGLNRCMCRSRTPSGLSGKRENTVQMDLEAATNAFKPAAKWEEEDVLTPRCKTLPFNTLIQRCRTTGKQSRLVNIKISSLIHHDIPIQSYIWYIHFPYQ